MNNSPVHHTNSIDFLAAPHTKSCRIQTQEECVCLWVKNATCPSCDSYALSAPRCKACRVIVTGRQAYVAAARKILESKK